MVAQIQEIQMKELSTKELNMLTGELSLLIAVNIF